MSGSLATIALTDIARPFEYVDQFPSQSRILKGEIDGIEFNNRDRHEATITSWFSPLEFHVVFTKHDAALRHLNAQLTRIYSTIEDDVDPVILKEGSPCAVKLRDGTWQRAYVDVSLGERVSVIMADSGKTESVPTMHAKRLVKEFAVLPPFAVPCKLNGCHRDICFRDNVDSITKSCKPGRKRFVLLSTNEVTNMVVVDLFDKNGNNLFDKYFGVMLARLNQAEMDRKQSLANQNKKKPRAKTSDTDSTEEDDFFDDEVDQVVNRAGKLYIVNPAQVTPPDPDDEEAWPSLGSIPKK